MTAGLPLLPLAVVPPAHVLMLAVVLFAVGLAGVTCRRNILIMLLSVEILLNAANLALVAFSKVHGDVTGQVFVFFAMTVAAAEVAVGLAIVIALYRLRRTADVAEVADLREQDYGAVRWPQLEGRPEPHGHHHGHDGHPGGAAPPDAREAPGPEPVHAAEHA